MSKTRILFLDQDYEYGGAQRTLTDLVKSLPDEDFEKYSLTLNKGNITEEFAKQNVNLNIRRIPFNVIGMKREAFDLFAVAKTAFSLIPAIIEIAIIIMKNNVDIIYSNTMEMHICGSLCSFISGRKIIWRLQDIVSSETNFSKTARSIIGFFAKIFPDEILCASNAVKKSLIDLGVREKKLRIVYNGIIIREFKSGLRTRLGIDNKTLIFGWAGRITRVKAPELFIKAAAKVKKQTEADCVFVILGGASPEESDYYGYLKELIIKNNIQDSVFLLGHMREPLSVVSGFDVFVHTAVIPDSLPIVILEAMSFKVPVIASNTGGVIEIIEDNKDGILYAFGDTDSIVRAMQLLITDSEKRKHLGMRGYEKLMDVFDHSKYIEQMKQVLRYER